MRKDDALQKANIVFMQNGSNERLLPSHNNYMVAWLTGIIFITAILLLFFIFLRKRRFK